MKKKKTTTKPTPTDRLGILTNRMPSSSMKMYFHADPNI